MTTFPEKLELAKAQTILTEEEYASAGGAYFDEDMGLWIRQDADGGGIVPFGWQMEMVRNESQAQTIRQLFIHLGRTADVDAYDQQAASYMGD